MPDEPFPSADDRARAISLVEGIIAGLIADGLVTFAGVTADSDITYELTPLGHAYLNENPDIGTDDIPSDWDISH